ncbi:MAG: hypothetical protein HeimC2_40020 [Candidatus Heimdallarchaeota archaeon LC_2]|nr:MAG: hypothetical protein HeimC2_40020 [Candidatus Heimdallarchaeota archaeon LC_2]
MTHSKIKIVMISLILIFSLGSIHPSNSQNIENSIYDLEITIVKFRIDGNPDENITDDNGFLEFEFYYELLDMTILDPERLEENLELNSSVELTDIVPFQNNTLVTKLKSIKYIQVDGRRANFNLRFWMDEHTTDNEGDEKTTKWNYNSVKIPLSNENKTISWETPYQVLVDLMLEYKLSQSNKDDSQDGLSFNYLFSLSSLIFVALILKITKKQ